MNSPAPGGMPPPYQPYHAPQKRHRLRNSLLAAAGVLAVIIAAGVAAGGGKDKPAASTPPAAPAAAPATPAAAVTQSAPAVPQYTPAQQQAIDAAGSYLSDGQGFSRAGLISQLHSPDGNGFSLSLATFAVDHVQVNWRSQAVIAAKGYMSDGEGFSCESLVQQLDSPYGSQFTVSQAEYAAKAVGL